MCIWGTKVQLFAETNTTILQKVTLERFFYP